jgi:hypothetical protein
MNKSVLFCLIAFLFCIAGCARPSPKESSAEVSHTRADRIPTPAEAEAAQKDVWGLAAMSQRNGASYEFFERLLPPLRYVNADFRYYPLLLSAPNAPVKARLISNGSGINLRGGARSWFDIGTPVTFRVGPDQFLFGGIRERVSQPTLAEGWLPIFEITYKHPTPYQSEGRIPLNQEKPRLAPEVYRLEAFAATEPALASNGVVFVKFDLAEGTNGIITLQLDSRSALRFEHGAVMDEPGQVLATLSGDWKWDRQLATARLQPGRSAVAMITTKPLAAETASECTEESYKTHREACARTWRDLLTKGMQVETPEPVVNNAWRHLLVQNFGMIHGDSIHYSSGNQYDRLYESEGSDAAMAFLNWGFNQDVRRLLPPLLDFVRKDLELHQAGFKLIDVCQYYWQTRDPNVFNELRPRWKREAERLATSRTNDVGLCPKQQYCGDIFTMVYSLTVDAKGWRALRDLAATLDQAGEPAEAAHYAENAAQFKKAVLAAMDKSINHSTKPPFVPVALLSDEPAHVPITHSRIGGYWNIVIGYVIGSGIYPPGSEEETWIPHFQEEHGGLCMGMLRANGGYTFWPGPFRVNPLYGTRYALDTLRRDDPERALVSFYGMLAQGCTKNTFVGAEGSSLTPYDEGGRVMYCPPNSASNAHVLAMLRHMLVQDWDLDDDGKPETLRLLFATPRRWLEDGKHLSIERAPTAFGPVSLHVESRLSQGKVLAQVQLPQRNTPKRTLLRIRVPDGWKVTGATNGDQELTVDAKGTADVSRLSGWVNLEFHAVRD